jgi:3-isopropylmalate/(R)-2-methylmalate dehydratase small subunit
VGESFAEIFFGNCVAIGIPCVTAPPETVRQLQTILQENPQAPMSVDLEAMQVRCGDCQAPVTMAEGVRQMFATGTWDNCGQLIAQVDRVRETAAKLPYLAWS